MTSGGAILNDCVESEKLDDARAVLPRDFHLCGSMAILRLVKPNTYLWQFPLFSASQRGGSIIRPTAMSSLLPVAAVVTLHASAGGYFQRLLSDLYVDRAMNRHLEAGRLRRSIFHQIDNAYLRDQIPANIRVGIEVPPPPYHDNADAPDGRDHVYGMLGLVTRGVAREMEMDHTKPASQVSVEVAFALMFGTGGLDYFLLRRYLSVAAVS
ncbi:hypothetical protein QBC43DRAFT_362798 [Cladorrhinum sp. PSN259]|nr:hypothetical protein QBC43DRAFT_362798 [Cladorrhinum sp. PSN259]